MILDYNRKLKENSQSLRKNLTKEESRLWYDFLKKLPVTVNRQKVIGNYIVDFYCDKYKTVIELDGSQHYDGEQERADRERDGYLSSLGITVLRYSNRDINERFANVCEDILKHFDMV